MFKFLKRKKDKDIKQSSEIKSSQEEQKPKSTHQPREQAESIQASSPAETVKPKEVSQPTSEKSEKPKKQGWFKRMRQGMSKTRSRFSKGMGSILLGKKEINEDILEEIEEQLLMADIGVDATQAIIDTLHDQLSRKKLNDGEAVMQSLQDQLQAILDPCQQPLEITSHKPFTLLVIGVNGAGKTTTIGKLAKHFQQQGLSVMLAAGDTFRAAAIEQLKVWGERNDIAVISQQTGSDSAAVIFDAMQSAQARNIVLLPAPEWPVRKAISPLAS